jgi:hypothetical protein
MQTGKTRVRSSASLHALRFATFSRSFRLDEDTSRTFDLVRKPRAPRPAASAEPHADRMLQGPGDARSGGGRGGNDALI